MKPPPRPHGPSAGAEGAGLDRRPDPAVRAGGADRAGALVLAALGALALAEALRIPDAWLGARLLPAVVGTALLFLAAAHLALPAVEAAWPDPAGGRRAALVFGLLALYVALLAPLGFLASTGLFVLVLLRVLGRFSWATVIGLAVAVALVSQVVFRRWLGMPLPPGILGG